MKVLIKGDERTFKVDCPSCYSTLEYGNSDIHMECRTVGSASISVTDCVIYCPICRHRIKVR